MQDFSVIQSLLQGSPLAAVLAFGLWIVWRAMEKKDAALLALTTSVVTVVERNTAQMAALTSAVENAQCPMVHEDSPFNGGNGRR